jgi:hypothetical protein
MVSMLKSNFDISILTVNNRQQLSATISNYHQRLMTVNDSC